MSAAHTEGLLVVEPTSDRNGPVFLIRREGTSLNTISTLDENYARRLAACWNACEGLTMDHFEGGWTAKGLSRHAKAMEDQLAAARALLTEFRDEADAWIKECGTNEVTDPNQILARVRAFLKGGA